jgi:L-ascorbate metabolism protein UlaG (beta-lactamase superfamily)
MQLIWLGHAGFKITTKNNFVIFIDPFAGEDTHYEQKASLILVSNEGYHHLSYEKIKALRADSTVILANTQSAYELDGTAMNPGDVQAIGDIKIKAVRAHSERPGLGKKEGEGLGFLLNIEGKIIYFAGTTDLIPEIKEIVCDVALLPVASATTMSSQEALQAVEMIKPKLAIPMHYGVFGGSIEEAELFKELVESKTHTKVWVLEPGKEYEI